MPRTTDNWKNHKAMLKRTDAYAKQVGAEFSKCVNDILALHKRLPVLDEGVMFSFDDTPKGEQVEVERLLRRLQSAATLAIQQGIMLEWEKANKANDALVQSCFGRDALKESKFGAFVQRNTQARDAFMQRNVGGLKLSDRIWKSCTQLREEMEVAMTVAIGEGQSASTMSRKVRQYLQDPELMFRRFRYKDENGNWQKKWKKRITTEDGKHKWIDYDKDSYKVGQGNYKSAAKNAMRVARTETNMAYRTADNTRMQQLDFVLGQEVKVSEHHKLDKDVDICDELAGVYPKDFKFIGWHPQCRCYMTTKLADWSEIAKMEDALDRGETYTPKGVVEDMPDNFNEWVKNNADKIAQADGRGTLPYFLRENRAQMESALPKPTPAPQATPKQQPAAKAEPKQMTAKEIAEQRHNARTQAEIDDIKARWAQHNQDLLDKQPLKDIITRLSVTAITPQDVARHTKTMTSEDIIQHIAGADQTGGSCSSQALTYIANRLGYNVTDYRGGHSQSFFARRYNVESIVKSVGGEVLEMNSDFKSAEALLAKMEKGKEYYFVAGGHAAMARYVEDNGAAVLQYLELQSGTANGWKALDKQVLRSRFGCKTRHTTSGVSYQVSSCIAEVSLFDGNSGLSRMMRYINTDPTQAKRGAGGGIK